MQFYNFFNIHRWQDLAIHKNFIIKIIQTPYFRPEDMVPKNIMDDYLRKEQLPVVMLRGNFYIESMIKVDNAGM